MEHHEGVYEQIIEVNNANQGTEYISHHLVQEIVVQSDNNQGSPMHDIDIMLPNDCANAPDQCNSNVIISSSTDGFGHDKHTENVNLQQEPIKSESITHLNHVEQNITSYDESYKEEYVLHSQTPYHQGNFEENSTVVHVTNSDTGNNEIISGTVTAPSESVPQIDENETVSIDDQPIHNHNLVNTSESIENDLDLANNKNVDESEQSDVYLNTEIEQSYVDSIPTDVVSNEVVQEVVMEEPQIQSENYCVNEHHEEVIETYATDSDVPYKSEETHELISTEMTEKMDYSMLVAEATSEDKIITNSDDVAVLTEFTSIEYSSTIDGPQEEVVISSEPIEVQDTSKENHEPQVSGESANQDASAKSEPDVISVEPTENNIVVEHIDQTVEANDTSVYDIDGEEDDLELHLSSQSENQRKVIQDIFDDWPDENGEDENNQSFKEHHDSVEMELQNLLNDDAQQEQIISSTSVHDINNFGNNKSAAGQNTGAKLQSLKAEKASLHNKTPSGRSSRSSTNLAKDHVPGRSCKTSTPDLTDIKKIQSPRPGVKVPGAHLTSQIASTAEVNEVLKERLKEKQRDLVTPNTADIVFVKKITQRLSSQLSAASSALPTLIPLPSSLPDDKNKDKPAENSVTGEVHKASSDKELLAILEGDVDPDWSDLKSQSLAEVSSSGDSNTGSKLDPSLERELALKQLQELPSLPSKKKQHKEQSDDQKNIIKKSLRSSEQSNSKSDSTTEPIKESSPKKEKKKAHKENNTQNTPNETVELTVEESRSGRKRKLTEKAREHELAVKRHKEKGKSTTESKKTQNESEEKSVEKPKEESETIVKVEETKPVEKLDDLEATDGEEIKITDAKRKLSTDKRKIGLVKKDAPIAKRKLTVKNFLRQKMTSRKTAVAAKTKPETSAPVKTTIPAKAATEKSEKSNEKSSEKSEKSPVPVTKAKKPTEVDKLLQDEGIVNMIFDAEQPDTRKRLVPITKSQKKIMDVDKAERELKLRTKLVKNAVMRLRNSSASAVKILPRSRRSATGASPEQPTKESEKKPEAITKQNISTPPSSLATEFIIPAKMHNAADASRIIRRHSSSSFSSASASPRVSVDMPPESLRSESPERLTKSKRKMSLDTNEKVEGKKTKKRTLSKAESEEEINQKSPAKEPLKKLTRSNVAAASTTTKIVAKNKKVSKSRASLDSSSSDSKSKSQDELMACLAEVASALLSSSSVSSRSSNTTTNRKKGSTNVSKTSDEEKVDIKKLSSYKEINVRQHGHLAQVILTPSSTSSGVRNALTIQVMNEIQDALSILKKHVECRVVLFTSTGTSFCEGLDLSSLLNPNKEERKARVEEMAHTVKAFIKTLAAFNKPIVAGVQGAAIGLGVTMLPLFDLVIASDKATFSTPYGKLGQIAEGAAVFTLSHSLGSAVTNELLLGGRTLTASEALRAGLVTRVLWPDRFQSELLPSLKSMSEQSSQSMEATKALLRCTLRKKLDAAIESESLLLMQHWCSTECQEAMKAYIEEKVQ